MKRLLLACLLLSGCRMTKNLTYTVNAYSPSEDRCTYYLTGCCGNHTTITDTCNKYQIGQAFTLTPK